MEPEVKAKLASLYDTDYQRWLEETVSGLKARDFSHLDLENLIEEIESLGKRDRRALFSYLLRLCEHLLKLQHWESERQLCFRGWVLEISHFRLEIESILEDSPSLKTFLRESFLPCYRKARKNMLQAIARPANSISPNPDFTLEQALDEDWLPWQPEL